jgi:hypothetical protein
MGYRRGTYRVLVGRREGKTPLGGPRCRWEDSVKIHREEVGWDGMAWIDLAVDWDGWWSPVNAVVNLPVPQNSGNLLTS